jgi:gliding motility-associated-like protein
MLRIILISVFLVLYTGLSAQNTFFKVVGANNTDVGDDLMTTQENGYAVLMHSTFNPPLNSRVNLGIVKTNAAGDIQYSSEIMIDSSCVGKKILELPNKDMFVLGTATHGSFMNSNKMFLLKTNNAGTPIWCYHYASTTSDVAADIIPTTDGNFLLLGTSNYNVDFEELVVIKIDPAGNIIWSKRIASPAHELTGVSIKEFNNGDIGIGATASLSLFLDVVIIKLKNNGDLLWKKTFSTTYDDELQKMVVNNINEIYITGCSYSVSSEWNIFIAKLDSSGDLQFQYFYDGGSYNGEKVRDMELVAGRIALIGDIGSYDERNMFLASIYTNGDIYFAKQYPYITTNTNYPFGLEGVNNNEYAFTSDIYTTIASREAGIFKTDPLGDLGCNTANLNLTRVDGEFVGGTVSITETDGSILKTNLTGLVLVDDLYLKTICEHIPPTADFDTTTLSNICPEQCFSFNDTGLYDPTSWKWYFSGAEIDTSTSQNPTNICWNNSGDYEVKLVVSNAIGSDSISRILHINLNCPIHIPNVFTPNTDGTNDIFEIYGLPENFDLVIYDRWGMLVFQSDSPTNMWNGKIGNEGAIASDGVYYYILNDYSNNKRYNSFLHVFN